MQSHYENKNARQICKRTSHIQKKIQKQKKFRRKIKSKFKGMQSHYENENARQICKRTSHIQRISNHNISCVAVCYNVLQCVAACCNVLQRVAVCCSVIFPRTSKESLITTSLFFQHLFLKSVRPAAASLHVSHPLFTYWSSRRSWGGRGGADGCDW